MRNCLCVMFFAFALSRFSCATEERPFTASEVTRYDKVTHALIAPCCWREPIAIHRSAEALEMLEEVKQFVAEGRSEEEIKAIYVARYGVRILADPPGMEGRWLYVIPIALSVTLVLLAVLRLRLLVARSTGPAPQAPSELIARVQMETGFEWSLK